MATTKMVALRDLPRLDGAAGCIDKGAVFEASAQVRRDLLATGWAEDAPEPKRGRAPRGEIALDGDDAPGGEG